MQRSLLLFIILLFVLTISVYFGNASLNVSEGPQGVNVADLNVSGNIVVHENFDGNVGGNVGGNVSATTPAATTPAATTPAATTPAATTPGATTPAATTPGATTPAATTPGATTPAATTPAKTTPAATTPQNPISDYYKWLIFWNTISNSNEQQIMMKTSSYVPKTSIPVIPDIYNYNNTCPYCKSNSGGVCVGCGGLGGGGSSSSYKNKFSDFLGTQGGGYRGDGHLGGGSSEPGLGKLAQEAGSGAVDLTKTVLNDATSLASGAGSGAVGLLKDTGSGAVGLLKDTGSGAVGLLKDAGSGVASLLESNPAQISSIQGSNQQTGNAGEGGQPTAGGSNNPYQSGYSQGIQRIDPYSYNGALVSKGGNYIPITNDFSSFRK